MIRITLTFNDGVRNFGSRFYLSYTGGPPSATNLNTLATAVSTNWNGPMSGLCTSQIALVEVVCADLAGSSGAQGIWTGSIAGTLGSNALSANSPTCIDFTVARHYRGGKPKIFLPLGSQSELVNLGNWTSTFIGTVNTNWSTFVNGIVATTGIGMTLGQHVNVSYYSGFASVQNPITKRWRNASTPRTTPVVDNVTSHACRARVGNQRRRTQSV